MRLLLQRSGASILYSGQVLELIAKKTSIEFYYPKVDILEYRRKIPDCLKYDSAELSKNSDRKE